jgi:transcriptional regulator with XRE-family HTH domain
MDTVQGKITSRPMPARDAMENRRAMELGAFLRTRRENLDPKRLGLPRAGRRRTPGLRREEVAQLADVGVTWYTWLEQGRPIQASARVLAAIAAALLCNEAETRHLFALAGLGDAVVSRAPACENLSAASQAILDHLDPLPAVLQNARFDIFGYNQAYCRLLGIDLARIDEADRNCIYLALTNPAWRACLADWDEVLPRMVAFFRAAMVEHMDDPVWKRQLDRYFAASPEFVDIWQRYEVRGIENHLKRFRHPRLGMVSLHQTNWWSAPQNGDRLLVYVPVDAPGQSFLAQLASASV